MHEPYVKNMHAAQIKSNFSIHLLCYSDVFIEFEGSISALFGPGNSVLFQEMWQCRCRALATQCLF